MTRNFASTGTSSRAHTHTLLAAFVAAVVLVLTSVITRKPAVGQYVALVVGIPSIVAIISHITLSSLWQIELRRRIAAGPGFIFSEICFVV